VASVRGTLHALTQPTEYTADEAMRNYSRPGGIHRGVLLFLVLGRKAKRSKGAKMTIQSPLSGLADYRPTERTRLVLALAELRCEWQQTTKGGSLLRIETPVGLLLADVADRLELTSQERYAFLGGRLINEVDAVREQRIRSRLPL